MKMFLTQTTTLLLVIFGLMVAVLLVRFLMILTTMMIFNIGDWERKYLHVRQAGKQEYFKYDVYTRIRLPWYELLVSLHCHLPATSLRRTEDSRGREQKECACRSLQDLFSALLPISLPHYLSSVRRRPSQA